MWAYFDIVAHCCSKMEGLRPLQHDVPHNITQSSMEAAIEWTTDHFGKISATFWAGH